MKYNILKFITFSLIVVIAAVGCSSKQPKQKSQLLSQPFKSDLVERDKIAKLHSILLLPVATSTVSTVCADQVRQYDFVTEAFQSEVGIKLKSDDEVLEALGTDWNAQTITKEMALSLASKFKTDGVMFIKVHSCQERVGSRAGVDKPAHLSFVVHLFTTLNAEEVWAGTYALKDIPLSENLLHIKDRIHTGPGWASAGDLMKYGLRLAAKEFEKQRTSSFLIAQ